MHKTRIVWENLREQRIFIARGSEQRTILSTDDPHLAQRAHRWLLLNTNLANMVWEDDIEIPQLTKILLDNTRLTQEGSRKEHASWMAKHPLDQAPMRRS